MLKGGYKIIDLKNLSLSDESVTIPGIYESIEGNYRKPLLLSGINLGRVEKADAFITAIAGDNAYTISVYGGTITITNENAVTYVTG